MPGPADALSRFIPLPENRSAHAAVVRLAADRRGDFPLFLHGPPGSGKSHLAAGLIERVTHAATETTAHTAAAAELGRALVMPPLDRRDARRDVLACDLLVLEDVQHLQPGAADEVAHILDQRQRRRKAVLVTAVRGPADLRLSARFTGRLAGGLVVGVQPLGEASRRVLAAELCRERGLRVDDAVIGWLARDPGGARPILGAIARLEALAKRFPPPLTLAVVRAELPDPEADASPLERLVEQVAVHYRVSMKALCGPSRVRNLAWPRQVAMYVARQAGFSFPEIGAFLGGRDHTTVMHGCAKVAERVAEDVGLRRELRDLATFATPSNPIP